MLKAFDLLFACHQIISLHSQALAPLLNRPRLSSSEIDAVLAARQEEQKTTVAESTVAAADPQPEIVIPPTVEPTPPLVPSPPTVSPAAVSLLPETVAPPAPASSVQLPNPHVVLPSPAALSPVTVHVEPVAASPALSPAPISVPSGTSPVPAAAHSPVAPPSTAAIITPNLVSPARNDADTVAEQKEQESTMTTISPTLATPIVRKETKEERTHGMDTVALDTVSGRSIESTVAEHSTMTSISPTKATPAVEKDDDTVSGSIVEERITVAEGTPVDDAPTQSAIVEEKPRFSIEEEGEEKEAAEEEWGWGEEKPAAAEQPVVDEDEQVDTTQEEDGWGADDAWGEDTVADVPESAPSPQPTAPSLPPPKKGG